MKIQHWTSSKSIKINLDKLKRITKQNNGVNSLTEGELNMEMVVTQHKALQPNKVIKNIREISFINMMECGKKIREELNLTDKEIYEMLKR